MVRYICDYLDDCQRKGSTFEFQKILRSLTPLFCFILLKTEVRLKERFLNLCFSVSPAPFRMEIPDYGKPKKQDLILNQSAVLSDQVISEIWEDGEEQIHFRTNFLDLDYDVVSPDMEKLIVCLLKQNNEEVFKTPLIRKIIQQLWNQSRVLLRISFFVFSIYMAAFSIYLTFDEHSLPYSLALLLFSIFLCFIEALQIYHLRENYFKDAWNVLDVTHPVLTIIYIIMRLAEYDNSLALAWISTIIVVMGYLRWVSHLRLFKETSKKNFNFIFLTFFKGSLIQVIITIANDMRSFMLIIFLLIIGFSLVFLIFEHSRGENHSYGLYLYNAYNFLYGPVGDDSMTNFSQRVFMCLMAFLLNVLLLNLLISIMDDSYDRMLEKKDKTNSITKLHLISESITFRRIFRIKPKERKGFLIYCSLVDESVEQENKQDSEWEGKINLIRKWLKHNDHHVEMASEVTEKRITTFEQEMRGNIEALERKIETHQEFAKEMNRSILKGEEIIYSYLTQRFGKPRSLIDSKLY